MERKDPVTRLDRFNFGVRGHHSDGRSLDPLWVEAHTRESLMSLIICSSLRGNSLILPLERGFTLSDATLWK